MTRRISQADEDLYITETAEAMDEDVVAGARRQVGIHNASELENKRVLVVDFGSTFSKIGTFDTATEEFSLRYVPTIVEDLRVSLADGLGVQGRVPAARRLGAPGQSHGRVRHQAALLQRQGRPQDGHRLDGQGGERFCRRPGGPDRRRQADQQLRRGAHRGRRRMAIYEQDQPEIILQAGGVDFGGDTETQLHNARLLARYSKAATYARYGVPVIYAGNQDMPADESAR